MTHDREPLPPALVTGFLLAALAVVVRTGSRPLAPSPLLSLGSWTRWLGRPDSLTVAVDAVRLLVAVGTCHLLAVQLLALAGQRARRPCLVRLARAFTPPPLRTSIGTLAGIGLGAVGSLTAAARSSAAPPPSTAVVRVVDRDPSTASVIVLDAPPAPPDDRASPPPATTEHREHVVRPGEHLWSIAEAELASAGEADVASVGRYWRRLVLANPQLDDPDLILPGDVISLPPVDNTG